MPLWPAARLFVSGCLAAVLARELPTVAPNATADIQSDSYKTRLKRWIKLPTEVEIASSGYDPKCDPRSRLFEPGNKQNLTAQGLPMYVEASWLGIFFCCVQVLKLLVPLLLLPQVPIPDADLWVAGNSMPRNMGLLNKAHLEKEQKAVELIRMKTWQGLKPPPEEPVDPHMVYFHMDPDGHNIALEELELTAMLLFAHDVEFFSPQQQADFERTGQLLDEEGMTANTRCDCDDCGHRFIHKEAHGFPHYFHDAHGGGRTGMKLYDGMPIYINTDTMSWHPLKLGMSKRNVTMTYEIERVGQEYFLQEKATTPEGEETIQTTFRLKKKDDIQGDAGAFLYEVTLMMSGGDAGSPTSLKQKWVLRPYTALISGDDYFDMLEHSYAAAAKTAEEKTQAKAERFKEIASHDGLGNVWWYEKKPPNQGKGVCCEPTEPEELEAGRSNQEVTWDDPKVVRKEVQRTRMMMQTMVRKQKLLEQDKARCKCCARIQTMVNVDFLLRQFDNPIADLMTTREKALRFVDVCLNKPVKVGRFELCFSERMKLFIFFAQTFEYVFSMGGATMHSRPTPQELFGGLIHQNYAWFWLTFRPEMLYPVVFLFLRGAITLLRLKSFFRETDSCGAKGPKKVQGRLLMYGTVGLSMVLGLPRLLVHSIAIAFAGVFYFLGLAILLYINGNCPSITKGEEDTDDEADQPDKQFQKPAHWYEFVHAIQYGWHGDSDMMRMVVMAFPAVVAPWLVGKIFRAQSADTYLCTFSHLTIYSMHTQNYSNQLVNYLVLMALLTCFVAILSSACIGMLKVMSSENVLLIWLQNPFTPRLLAAEEKDRVRMKKFQEKLWSDNRLADIARRHMVASKHLEWQRVYRHKQKHLEKPSEEASGSGSQDEGLASALCTLPPGRRVLPAEEDSAEVEEDQGTSTSGAEDHEHVPLMQCCKGNW